eukprot:Sdes_comp17162_c0_seq1m6324
MTPTTRRTAEKVPSAETINWVKPASGLDARWNGFKRSGRRDQKSLGGRRWAQCSHCKIVLEGRLELLAKHMMQCNKVAESQKAKYAADCFRPSSSSSNIPNDSLEDKLDSPSAGKRPRSDCSTSLSRKLAAPFGKTITDRLHLLLLKALTTAGIPFSFADNPYFIAYQRELARCQYLQPSSDVLSRQLLPRLVQDVQKAVSEQLRGQRDLTLAIEGHVDDAGNSVFALMLSKGTCLDIFVEKIECNWSRQTPEWITDRIFETLQQRNIDMDCICALVIGPSSIFKGLESTFSARFPHIVRARCCLHNLYSLVRQVCKSPIAQSVVQNNKKMIHYFSRSEFYGQVLLASHKHEAPLPSHPELPSIGSNCVYVRNLEPGFRQCVEMSTSSGSEGPGIPKEVVDIVSNRAHFEDNLILLAVLKPFMDTIDQLISPEATLAELWKQLISCYQQLSAVKIPSKWVVFRDTVLKAFHNCLNVFMDDIYFIAFFLNPRYRKMAASRLYDLEDYVRMMMELGKKWKYSKQVVKTIGEQIFSYFTNQYPFNPNQAADLTPFSYWTSLPGASEPLRGLALSVLQISPCALSGPRLASVMPHIGPVSQQPASRSVELGRALAQVRSYLLRNTSEWSSHPDLLFDLFPHPNTLLVDDIKLLGDQIQDSDCEYEEILYSESVNMHLEPNHHLEKIFDIHTAPEISSALEPHPSYPSMDSRDPDEWDLSPVLEDVLNRSRDS